MASKSREELEAFIKKDRERAEDAVRTLMRMDPSDRKAVLLARWFEHGVRSDPENMKLAEEYALAWSAVDTTNESEVALRFAIEREFFFRSNQRKESETMKKLAERVENLEAMLGQVLNRLPEE